MESVQDTIPFHSAASYNNTTVPAPMQVDARKSSNDSGGGGGRRGSGVLSDSEAEETIDVESLMSNRETVSKTFVSPLSGKTVPYGVDPVSNIYFCGVEKCDCAYKLSKSEFHCLPLFRHMMSVHLKEKAYQCRHEGCNLTFETHEARNRHELCWLHSIPAYH
eukprot:Nk52_evm1s111 gene=Nk52_evmTU1s111